MSQDGHQATRDVEHVVVIGGGAAGCATAYYLAAAGAQVTIVEREGVGSQASGWSAGGLNPLQGIPAPIAALAMQSYRLHLELWPQLAAASSQDLAAGVISMAMVARTEADIPPLLEQQAGFEGADGFSARWIEAAELRQQEPRITADVSGALLTNGNAILESQRFTLALSEAAQHHGATLKAGAVTGIQHEGRQVTGVTLEDGVIACDAAVIAMGPWSGAAADWLSVPLPVEPLKGEIVRMALAGPPLPFDIVTPAISLFGRPDGQVWLASTQQRLGFDREPSAWGYQTLYEPAVDLMPAIRDATLVRQTACLRPLSADDLPVAGAVPGWQGAYVATAGGTKGILLAPGMGRAIADLILTGQTAVSIEGCSLERFAAAAT
ncbi:MAG: NAD(P)/FAD-dependent oxidoreductase [Chloroflexota bacterium]